MADELEELKALTQNHLASIVWPPRGPRDDASYINEFANHIKIKFNEPNPSKFSRELNEFSNLRNIALSTLGENSLRDRPSLQALKRYYSQLVAMLARFRDSGAEFSWKNSFSRGSVEGNLEFELNNVMYNIAAIHNEFGSKIAKTNESSTKEACLDFRCALWWVAELRDNRTGTKPKELGHDLLTFYYHVLQAQAQECVLLHSLRAKMKPENVAKIAAQIASDYDVANKLALSPLYSDPLKEIISSSSAFPSYRATVEFKHKYFLAMTQLLLGLSIADDNAKEIGVRVARLRNASQLLEQAKKIVLETIDSQTSKSALTVIESLVNSKLEKSIRYNDNVYHAPIPSREALAIPEAKLLVDPLPFDGLPDFKDLFSSLVTIESVQVNSIYSQKKDELSREMSQKVEKQDEELAQMMSTLNIDKRSLRMPPVEVPDDLMEICAELSVNPSIVDDVLAKLKEHDNLSNKVQQLFASTEEALRRKPDAALKTQLERYKMAHKTAMQTTQTLHKQFSPEMQQKIRSIATTNNPVELLPNVDNTISSQDEEVIRKLEKLLDKVDEMKQQRASLLKQLRQSLNDDDVIKHVVAANSDLELKSVFDKEIQKHNKFLQPLQANLALQNEMLDTLERINAQFGQVRLNYRARKAAYNERVASLKKCYNDFKELSKGVDNGLLYSKQMLELSEKLYATAL